MPGSAVGRKREPEGSRKHAAPSRKSDGGPKAVEPRSALGAPSALTFATLSAETVGVIAAQWATLATRASGDNIFFHPDFAIPAMGYLGRGSIAVATVSTSCGDLRGLTLFTRTWLGRVAPAVRLWSHHYGPFGMPLMVPESVEGTVATLIDGLAPAGSVQSLIVPDLPLDGAVAGAFFKVAKRAGRPVAVLQPYYRAALARPAEGTIDVRASISSGRRKEYGRQLRRLGELGKVTVEMDARADRVKAAFEAFVTLEAAGWKGRRGTALASGRAISEFAREVVAKRAAAGAVRVASIRVDTRPIAMVVCLIGSGTAFTWKIAYDEAFARFSPGAQLMIEVASRLFEDPAITCIDSCAFANHPMIDPLWPGRRPIGTLAIGPPGGGALYNLGLAGAKAEAVAVEQARQMRDRLPRPLNRLLRGRRSDQR